MELVTGDIICVRSGSTEIIWRVSKVDGKLLKYFDAANNYNQIPLQQLEHLINAGCAVITKD